MATIVATVVTAVLVHQPPSPPTDVRDTRITNVINYHGCGSRPFNWRLRGRAAPEP
ncbi:MAG: hypothetical protein ACLPKI_23085 [Streptosporangiaceae bacterium]